MLTVLEVKRIDLWALFKVAFFVYAVLGLIGGFFYLFFMMLATGIGGAFLEEELPNFGLLGGALGIIMMPVLAFVYGAIGSVMATICGAIINLIMKATGGVRFDVEMAAVGGVSPAPVAAEPPLPAPAPTSTPAAPEPPPAPPSTPGEGGTPPPGPTGPEM